MASKKIFDVMVSTGSYTGDDGQEKQRWMNVGVMFKNDSGYVSIKLEAVPTKRNEQGELWLSCFAPKPYQPKDQRQSGFTAQAPEGSEGFRDKPQQATDNFGDEKIPF